VVNLIGFLSSKYNWGVVASPPSTGEVKEDQLVRVSNKKPFWIEAVAFVR
jgi:hypothetical protein